MIASLPGWIPQGWIAGATLGAGGLILLAGAIEDFRHKKFPNWMFLGGTALGFSVSAACLGWSGAQQGAMGFLAGIALLLPLVFMGAVGAGDMKLVAAFGAACGWPAALETAFFWLAWGAVFGVAQALLSGQGRAVVKNVAQMAGKRSSEGLELHRIPFAAALLVGWLTHLARQGLL
jgi:prepilin peptidase CpaA